MGGPPRYDPSKPDGAGQQAPLKEEYRRIHEASMADQALGGPGLYVMSVKCIPMGMPFQMSIVFPFEFVITPKTTYVLFEIMTSQPRRIYTDGRDWPKDPDPTFTGYSIGKWIDRTATAASMCWRSRPGTCGCRGCSTRPGFHFIEDGQAVIKERIYADKANPNIIHDEMTTIDNALTRPWSVKKTYRREPKVVWPENNCTEGNNDVVIGSESYLLSADGYLMPVKKDQPPPDLRYFNQTKK